MKKKIILPALAIVLAGGIFGVTQVSAQSTNSSTLVSMIAQRFNLDQSQVQSVFDQYRSQRKAQIQQRLKTRLDQAVSQGKITAAQEQSILNELSSLQSKYGSALQSGTPAERKQALVSEHNELKSWLQSQGINLSGIVGFGMGMHKGWFKPSPSTTPPPQT